MQDVAKPATKFSGYGQTSTTLLLHLTFVVRSLVPLHPRTAVLTLRRSKLCVNMAYSGLSQSPEGASHIHGPAGVGADREADVLFTLSSGEVKNPSTGDCFTITSEQSKQLLAGSWYIAVHTTQCGQGELRGQIFPVSIA
jgi:hypothetical protein